MEATEKQKAPENQEAPVGVESPEQIRKHLMDAATQETDQFHAESATDISQMEARAEKEELVVDAEDRSALQELGIEADAAKDELLAEVGDEESEEVKKEAAIKKQPRFIKEFSKQQSPEERNQLAQEIREKRNTHFKDKKSIEVKEQEKSEVVKQLEVLQNQIESYNDASFFVKIKDFFAIKSVEAQLQEKFGQQVSIEKQLSAEIPGRSDLDETRTMLANFYADEKRKWAEAPYSKEDIIKNFTEEHLSSLSTNEYMSLLQRFPSEMVTHVSRHGVRDHADLGNHQKGLGEYHDTLRVVLQKKELRSALGITLQESSKEDAVANFLQLDNCPNRYGALGRISTKFKNQVIGDPNAFADNSAIHFAAEEVADSFYGGESGNEIFFAFPSALVASQYEFSGNLAASGGNNDQFIWPDIEKGMPIDAGIAFIPEDVLVDSENGSRYSLNESMEVEPALGISEILAARFGGKSGFVQTFIQQSEKLKNTDEAERAFSEFEITDTEMKKALVDKELLGELNRVWGSDNEKDEYAKILTKYFQKNRLSPYKLAGRTISSKEYWENFFQNNPDSRPKHIVYYSGGDPTKTLNDWRKNNGIIKKDGRSDLGFSENEKDRDVKNRDETQQRFVSIAKDVVDKYFPTDDGKDTLENWRF
jgi:hypothetical protein